MHRVKSVSFLPGARCCRAKEAVAITSSNSASGRHLEVPTEVSFSGGGPCVMGAAALPFTAMLYFDIRSLEARAESVEATLSASDPVWEADDVLPLGTGVNVHGRLSGAGHGRFFFSGSFDGTAASTCRRCLTDVQLRVSEVLQLLFAVAGLDEAEEDDVVPIPPGSRELDLRPAVREEWLLAVPAFALCRDDCKGLCPTCGADRNTGACSCAPDTDVRWAGLRDPRTPDA